MRVDYLGISLKRERTSSQSRRTEDDENHEGVLSRGGVDDCMCFDEAAD